MIQKANVWIKTNKLKMSNMLKDLNRERKILTKQIEAIEKRIQDELKIELESITDSDSFFKKFMSVYFTDDDRGVILTEIILEAHIKDEAVRKDLLRFASRLLVEDITGSINKLNLNWAYTAMYELKKLLEELNLDELAYNVEDLAERMDYTTPESIGELFEKITKEFYKVVPERDIKISKIEF